MPASSSAARAATRPISLPLTSARPNGCRPTPTIETVTPAPPSTGRTGTTTPGRRAPGGAGGELDRLADPPLGHGLALEAGLDAHRSEVDVADGERFEVVGAFVRWLRTDALHGAAPDRAGRGQRGLEHRLATARARRLDREGVRVAGAAPRSGEPPLAVDVRDDAAGRRSPGRRSRHDLSGSGRVGGGRLRCSGGSVAASLLLRALTTPW